jgi:hypothetical protein
LAGFAAIADQSIACRESTIGELSLLSGGASPEWPGAGGYRNSPRVNIGDLNKPLTLQL